MGAVRVGDWQPVCGCGLLPVNGNGGRGSEDHGHEDRGHVVHGCVLSGYAEASADHVV